MLPPLTFPNKEAAIKNGKSSNINTKNQIKPYMVYKKRKILIMKPAPVFYPNMHKIIPCTAKKNSYYCILPYFKGRGEESYSILSYICTPKIWLVMFAVIKIAGQQFKVKSGQSLFVPHLSGKSGDKVEFSDIMFLENNGEVFFNEGAKASVTAEIINDLIKGEKVIAFKMKRRKGFRKKHGHRTQYTQIKITDISGIPA